MDTPETNYVSVGDADVAYKVFGEGPFDLLCFYGLGNHIEFFFDTPGWFEEIPRMASFSRVILMDRRGTGASDPVPRDAIPTWEEWTEDVVAVLDAVGSKRTAILAILDAGPIAILFAAMHPERVSSLVLFSTTARFLEGDDYPCGMSGEVVDSLGEILKTMWGTPELTALGLPSLAGDPEALRSLARHFRCAATPRTAGRQITHVLKTTDVRQALPFIQVPTLVLNARESAILPVEQGRYLAEHIDNATFVELEGGDSGFSPARPEVVDQVAEFLTGERTVIEVDRILATVLFSDIVGSTSRASEMGDRRWRVLLDAHDRVIRDQIRRFRGKEIVTTGDGFVLSFDGPARAIRCAQAMIEATGKLGVDIRVGLHTGECEVRGESLAGLAVHIAARVGAMAGTGDVLVSGTVKDLVVGSGIDFVERGEHELKGVPGSWRLYAVKD